MVSPKHLVLFTCLILFLFFERSVVSEYGTRSHRDLQIPKVWLEYAKRSFYVKGIKY